MITTFFRFLNVPFVYRLRVSSGDTFFTPPPSHPTIPHHKHCFITIASPHFHPLLIPFPFVSPSLLLPEYRVHHPSITLVGYLHPFTHPSACHAAHHNINFTLSDYSSYQSSSSCTLSTSFSLSLSAAEEWNDILHKPKRISTLSPHACLCFLAFTQRKRVSV